MDEAQGPSGLRLRTHERGRSVHRRRRQLEGRPHHPRWCVTGPVPRQGRRGRAQGQGHQGHSEGGGRADSHRRSSDEPERVQGRPRSRPHREDAPGGDGLTVSPKGSERRWRKPPPLSLRRTLGAMPASEQRLGGGRSSVGVVRIGDTVHRPTGPWTPTIHAYLRHLRAAGFTASPEVLGIDEKGREVLTYIPGDTWGDHIDPDEPKTDLVTVRIWPDAT